MKISSRKSEIAIFAVLLFASALSGCGNPQPAATSGTNGAASHAASNLTPQVQEQAQAAAQHDGEASAAAARQQSQHH